MKLLTQPNNGATAILDAINGATESIAIAIFRCDYAPIEKALVQAVSRGVAVRALIASTNRGGEVRLRGLETRLLAAGAIVARTNTDLARYHGKYLIVDEEELYVLAYNFTRADLHGTRSFGVRLKDKTLVKAALQLFESDSTRQPYEIDEPNFLVSPVNARERLAAFLEGARKSLLIYDTDVSDPEMITALRERVSEGVEVRIIGHMKNRPDEAGVRMLYPLRLHCRTIVRDGADVFIGSQSLRRLELDGRREVGVLVHDAKVAAGITEVFEQDWADAKKEVLPATKVAKRVAKAITKDLGAVAQLVEKAAAKSGAKVAADSDDVDRVVREAVKAAVKEAVQEVVSSAAQ